MSILSIANQAPGPLPIKATFKSPTDGSASLMLAGSVWSGTANQKIGIQIALDGKVIGTASIFSNGTSTHRAVVPTYVPVQLTIGSHTIELTVLNSVTISDLNDFFDVSLLY
jgi:hypothetical protein